MEDIKLQEMNIEFPDVFVKGELEENWNERSICADALYGWACCSMVKEIPKNFGIGMALIAGKLGFAPTEENVTKHAINKGWLKQ